MAPSSTHDNYVARVENLTKSFGGGSGAVVALDGSRSESSAGNLRDHGPSGSGKSTLMHVMAGLDSPTSGQAWLGETEISHLGDMELTLLRRRRIGFVFQSYNLVPTLDIRGNIYLPFELDSRRPDEQGQQRVEQLIVFARPRRPTLAPSS